MHRDDDVRAAPTSPASPFRSSTASSSTWDISSSSSDMIVIVGSGNAVESHRRSRRPRHRAGDDRGRHVRRHRLGRRQRDLLDPSRTEFHSGHGRARRCLRRRHWRGARLPVVQRAARLHLHGRHGLAGARRAPRNCRRSGEARDRAGNRRRTVRAGGDVRHSPGRLLQDDRQAHLPDGADSITISRRWDGRSRRSSSACGSSHSCSRSSVLRP